MCALHFLLFRSSSQCEKEELPAIGGIVAGADKEITYVAQPAQGIPR